MKRLIVASAILAGAGVASYFAMTAWPSRAPENVDVVASADTFQLRSTGAPGSCAVTRGDQLSNGKADLRVDPSCAAVLPGVEKAKFWVEKDDGSVAFTENGIDPIVTFAVADGVAYESLAPAQPVVSLDAEQRDAEAPAE